MCVCVCVSLHMQSYSEIWRALIKRENMYVGMYVCMYVCMYVH